MNQALLVAFALESAFAEGQLDLIKLTPLSWLPLIPIQALLNSVDVAHDVGRGAESANAAMATGFFGGHPRRHRRVRIINERINK